MHRREFVAAMAALTAVPQAKAQQEPAPSPGTLPNEFVKDEKAKAMQYHSERPLTGSVPAHEHDFDVTPNDRMFVRNNLLTPGIDIHSHRLAIKGLVDKELSFSAFDLAKNFRTVTMQGMLECAGSGRSAYRPAASGTPWLETGGMGCPAWGGVRLADLLKAAGLKPNAAHVAGQGVDPGLIPTAEPVIIYITMKKEME